MRWGIALIVLGILGLGSSFGRFSWDFWNAFWALLPLALILWGLNLILKESKARVPILFCVALVGGLSLYSWAKTTAAPGTIQSISEDLHGATQVAATLSAGVGKLELGSLNSASDKAIEGQVELVSGERLERSAERSGNTLNLRLEAKGITRIIGNRRPERWDLKLSPRVLLRLKVKAGLGENLLDLRGLKLSSLEVDSGVGSTQVRLPSQGQYNAKVAGGVGGLEIHVPKNVGLRLRVSTGLGGVELPPGLITKGDKHYESSDYSTAIHRVDLMVTGGIGGIVIRR